MWRAKGARGEGGEGEEEVISGSDARKVLIAAP